MATALENLPHQWFSMILPSHKTGFDNFNPISIILDGSTDSDIALLLLNHCKSTSTFIFVRTDGIMFIRTDLTNFSTMNCLQFILI